MYIAIFCIVPFGNSNNLCGKNLTSVGVRAGGKFIAKLKFHLFRLKNFSIPSKGSFKEVHLY